MKTTFYLLLISITLLACRTTKSATENMTETRTKTTQQSDSSKTDIRFAEMNLEQIEKQSGEWSAKLTTYDSTLPVEKTTGKPPVKSELLITNKTQAEIKTTEKENSKSLAKLKISVKSESSKKEKTHNSEQSSRWWVWILVGIGIPILLFLGWKLVPKYRKLL
jgi:cobalamin biosynthesis Mg chelatase CobN